MKMFKQYLALFLSISLIFSNTLTSLAVTERTKHLDGIELDNVATPSDAVIPSDSSNSGDNLDNDEDIELDDDTASDSNATRPSKPNRVPVKPNKPDENGLLGIKNEIMTMDLILELGDGVVSADRFEIFADGNSIGAPDDDISVGAIDSFAPDLSNQQLYFYSAEVNGVTIEEVGILDEIIYYSTRSGNLLILDDSDVIELYYNTEYSVEYNYTDSLVSNNPERVANGGTLSFYVEPSTRDVSLAVTAQKEDGSQITDIASSVSDSSTGKMLYSIHNIDSNITVTIEEVAVGNFVFTYDSSNILNGKVTSPSNNSNISIGGTIEIVLRSTVKYNEMALNMLYINGYSVKVPPTTAGRGDSVTSSLPSGENVTVEKTQNYTWPGSVWNNEYTITIQNIHTDISISRANLKNIARNEIILKEKSGIGDMIGWDATTGNYANANPNSSFLQKGSGGNNFYFNVATGYANPQLRVLLDGSDYTVNINNNTDSGYSQYRYKFNIPSGLSNNIELYLSASAVTYNVVYNNDKDASDIIKEPETGFTVLDGKKNILIITSKKPKANNEFYADGWKIANDTSNTVYHAGDTVRIEDIAEFASSTNTINLVPNWVSLNTGDSRNIDINIYIENPLVTSSDQVFAGTYADVVSKQGTSLIDIDDGQANSIIGNYLVNHGIAMYNVDDYEIRDNESVFIVQESMDSIDVHYDLSKVNLTVQYQWATQEDASTTVDLPDPVVVELPIEKPYTYNNDKTPSGYMAESTVDLNYISRDGALVTIYLYKDDDGDNVPDSSNIELRFNAGSGEFESYATDNYSYNLENNILTYNLIKKHKAYEVKQGNSNSQVFYHNSQNYPKSPVAIIDDKSLELTGWYTSNNVSYGEFAGTVISDTANDAEFNAKYDLKDNYHTLTVRYIDQSNGAKIHDDFIIPVADGETVQYPIPSIDRFVRPTNESYNSFTMNAYSDVTINEKYWADSNDNSKPDEFEITVKFIGTGHGSWDNNWTNMQEGIDYTLSRVTEDTPLTLTAYLVKQNNDGFEADVWPLSPAVVADTYYIFDTWKAASGVAYDLAGSEVSASADSVEYTSYYFDDKNNNKIKDVDEYVTVTFNEGDHGTIENGAEGDVTYSNLLPGYSRYPNEPNITADKYWIFDGWDKAYQYGEIIVNTEKIQKFTAIYAPDFNENNVDDRDEYVSVTFNAGEHGILEGESEFTELLPGDKYPEAPTVVSKDDWLFTGWDAEYAADSIISADDEKEQVYNAIYAEDRNHNKIDDSTEYITITFSAGEHGSINGTSVFENLLPGYSSYPSEPEVVADKTYKFNGWDIEYTSGTQIPLGTTGFTVTAQYFLDANDNNIDDTLEYVTITFNAGTFGTLEDGSKTKVYSELLPELDRYPEAPNVVADKNHLFNSWDKIYAKGDIVSSNDDKNQLFSAVYNDDFNHTGIDDRLEKINITFDAGEHGSLNGHGEFSNLLPGYNSYPTAPTVTSNECYLFIGWNNEYSYSGTIDLDYGGGTYTALYAEDKNNNQIDDSLEKISIIFDAGEHGSINGSNIFVVSELLPGYDKYPDVPVVDSNKDWLFTGFKEYTDLAGTKIPLNTVSSDYEASYVQDKNDNDIDDSTEYVILTFDGGEHGSINGQYQITGLLPGYDKYPDAPIVTTDVNWKFIGWNPSYTVGKQIEFTDTQFSFTAQYGEDFNNNDILDSDEYITIKFEAGEHGSLNGTSEFNELVPGYSKYPSAPGVNTSSGFMFAGWDVEYTSGDIIDISVTEDIIIKATYAPDRNHNNIDDTTEYVTVKFEIGDNGYIIHGQSEYTNLLPYVDLYPQEPDIEANEGWVFTGWDKEYPTDAAIQSTEKVQVWTAQYAEDLNNTNKPDSEEYVTIIFNAGDHGRFADGAVTKYENILPGYSRYPNSPDIIADENWKFTGWTPVYTDCSEVENTDKIQEFTATYVEDKNNNDIDDSTELVTVKFNAGDNGIIVGNSEYADLLPGYNVYPTAPSVSANKNWKFNSWSPEYKAGEVITNTDKVQTFTANYKEDFNNNDIFDDEEYISIQFMLQDATDGHIDGQDYFDKLLPGYSKYPTGPNVTAKEGKMFGGWDYTFIPGETIGISTIDDIVVFGSCVNDRNNNNIPDTQEYIAIEFSAGEHGNLGDNACEFNNLLPGLDTYPEAPEVISHKDWVFIGWNKEFTSGETIEADAETMTITAIYVNDKNNNTIPDYDEYVTVVLKAGDHGSFLVGGVSSEVIKEVTYDKLLPDFDKYPDIPGIIVESDYKIKGMTPEYNAGAVITDNTKTQIFEVTYFEDKNNNNIDDTSEYVTVEFSAGEHGSLDGTNKFEKLLPGYDVYPTAPTVVSNKDWLFAYWDSEYKAGEVITDTTKNQLFKAEYVEDKNNNKVDDTTEYISIAFRSGDHGDIISVNGNKVNLYHINELLPGYDVYPEAPSVEAEENYKFKRFVGYEAGKLIESTEKVQWFDASYIADFNNNDIDDTTEYISITFRTGDNGTFSDGSDTYVIHGLLPNYDRYPEAPEVTANENNIFKGFSSYNKGDIITETSDVTFTASYYEDFNNNHVDDSTEYISIIFNAGEHGTMDGVTEYNNLLPGYDVYPTEPKVESNKDYIFIDWDTKYNSGEIISSTDKVQTFTAVYGSDKNNNNVLDETEYITVKFEAGTNGKLLGTTEYNGLLALYDVYPKAPEVKANENYEFIGFTTEYTENALIEEGESERVYVATYEYVKPTEPEEPEEPSEPEEPEEPEEPSEPEKPTEPSKPEEPSEPETPDTPSNDGGDSKSSSSAPISNHYINGLHGTWVHMDTNDHNKTLTKDVPYGSNPLETPEWHRWKFVKNDGSVLYNTWAHVTNPYATDGQADSGWFHFDHNGLMNFGWYYDPYTKKYYYLHSESDGILGSRKTGWHFDKQDNMWYYLDPNSGHMVTGWNLIDGKWYYFNEGSSNSNWSIDEASGIWVATSSDNARPYGSMYINEVTPDGNRVDETGALIN